jgi:hypothetical protein
MSNVNISCIIYIHYSCRGSVNSGQLYLKNSSRAQKYLTYMMEKKTDIILFRRRKLDQGYVLAAATRGKLIFILFFT